MRAPLISDAVQRLVRLPPLPWERQLPLLREAQAGSREAREALLKANSRWVLKRAMRRWRIYSTLNVDDLFQEGMVGLNRAIDDFDESLGFRFITYATWWVDQSIIRYHHDHGSLIRVPSNQHLSHYRRVYVDPADVAQALRTPVSLDHEPEVSTPRVVSPERKPGLYELLATEHTPDTLLNTTREDVLEHMGDLKPMERAVILALLEPGEPTLGEVGARLGYTRERIRQIQVSAVTKMARSFGSQVDGRTIAHAFACMRRARSRPSPPPTKPTSAAFARSPGSRTTTARVTA